MLKPSLSKFISIANLALAIGITSFLVYLASRGYDITDEGYYLNEIKYPLAGNFVPSLYGQMLNPILTATGENIFAFRAINIASTTALSLVVCMLAINTKSKPAQKTNSKILLHINTAAMSAVGFSIFINFTTPSYNSLIYIGCLFFAACLLLKSTHKLERFAFLPNALFAISIFLASAGRPTSGAALSLLLVTYSLLSKNLKIISSLAIVFTSMFLYMIAGSYYYGSTLDFYRHLITSIQNVSLLGVHTGSHALSNFLESIKTSPIFYFSTLTALQVITIFEFVLSKKDSNRHRTCSLFRLSTASILLCFAAPTLYTSSKIQNGTYNLLAFYSSLALGSLLIVSIHEFKKIKSKEFDLITPLALCMIPLCYAAGTGNNPMRIISICSLPFVAAFLFTINQKYGPGRIDRYFSIVTLSSLLPILVLVKNNYFYPYRQEMIGIGQGIPTKINDSSHLYLSKNQNTYLSSLNNVFNRYNLPDGIKILDWTGHSPGTIFATQAYPAGQTWIIGGYGKGSNEFAQRALSKISAEEKANMLILLEPKGTRALDNLILLENGINISDSNKYRLIGKFQRPNLKNKNKIEQHLYMPINHNYAK